MKEAQKQFTDIQLQSGSPLSQLVRLNEVSSPGEPAQLYSKKIRNAAAVAGLSVVLAVGAAFAVEGVSRSRKRRREAQVAPKDAAPRPSNGATGWSTEPKDGARPRFRRRTLLTGAVGRPGHRRCAGPGRGRQSQLSVQSPTRRRP